jgi:dUTPase
MVIPHPTLELIEVDELSDTERGEGGFGSTGK